MDQTTITLLREEFPDLDEFLGELWLQWDAIREKQRQWRTSAKRWEVLLEECRRVRREVHGEARPSRTIKFSELHKDEEVVDRIISDPHAGRYIKRRNQRRGNN